MSLAAQERETYEAVWAVPAYTTSGSPGAQLLPLFLDMMAERKAWHGDSVLDAGCGAGAGALALQAEGFRVTLADITDAGLSDEARTLPFHQVPLWTDLRRVAGYHDWVYCCDVLEHVPPALTMLVVSRLLEVARKGVFLSIGLVPDVFGVWVGKPLHRSLWSYTEWRSLLNTVGTVVESRDLLINGVYLVRPC